MAENINKRIAMFRKLANLTQKETAEKLGINSSTYSQREREGNISADMIMKLADIFGVKPETLLYGDSVSITNDLPHEITELHQDVDPFNKKDWSPTPLIPTHNEENLLKILRNLPKTERQKIFDLVDQKYKEYKNH